MTIKILSLSKWLSLFSSKKISYKEFLRRAIVRSSYDYKLTDLILEGKISKNQAKQLYYKIVIDKDRYLNNFYNNNLKLYDSDYGDKKLVINNNKYPKFKNIVRNLYYKEILLETDTEQKNLRNFLEVIIELYKYYIIDYKLVTPSVLNYIEDNKLSSMLSGLYFRASIMNPFLVYSLSKLKFKNPRRVFTPTLGWSSYLLGFMQNVNLIEYVGVDVIPKVCATTESLARKIRPDIKLDIYCVPSEDLYRNIKFKSRYKKHFDVVFFSPPYYKLEIYSGNKQSTNRYNTYGEWLKKYFEITIKLCNYCLRPNGILCYIISGYKIGNEYLDLDGDMNSIICHNGFKHSGSSDMANGNVGFTTHRKQKETINYFIKVR